MPGKRTIDFMNNQIKPRTDLNALSRHHHLAKGSRTRLFPKGANLNVISMSLLYIKANTFVLLGFFYLTKGNRTRLLLFILGEQILTLYTYIFHLGGATPILHERLSQFLRLL